MTIATHKTPDADALVSTWITERFLFSGAECQVEFVPRNFDPRANDRYDAVLDVGRVHNPEKLTFDHKPPAFEHRDAQCATSLVWQHAQSVGCQVEHLQELVEVVHDGDAASRSRKSKAYARSRSNGLHAVIKCACEYAQDNPQMHYQGIAAYLNAVFLREK